MRKIIAAAALAAIASIVAVSQASAQAFYPNGSARAPVVNRPYQYPGGYGVQPTYPPQYPTQYPTTQRSRHDDDRYTDRERDRDDRRSSAYDAAREREWERSGNRGVTGNMGNVPSRVPVYGSSSTSRNGNRDNRWNDHSARDSRDGG